MVGKIALILVGFGMVLSVQAGPIKPQNLSTSLTVLPITIPGKEAITNEEAETIDLFQLEPPTPGQIITVKCAEGFVRDDQGNCVEKVGDLGSPEDLCALFGIGCK